jgi:KAP family P-loop domain
MSQEPFCLRWRILPDEEVSRAADDAFGVHTAYAKHLARIARSCPTPFTVGLYSGWGTGKTSIVRLLQELVEADSGNQIQVIYLDVWKYASDPLKRWILLETERQLTDPGLLREYRYQDRSLQSHLEFDEELHDEDRLRIDVPNLRYIGTVTAALIAASLLSSHYVPERWRAAAAIRWLLTVAAGGTVVAFALQATFKAIGESLSKLLFRRTIRHVTVKPAFSSEKFGMIFRDMAGKAIQSQEGGRLLFVFDNLDRCPAHVAVDAIGVVKTFLDVPGCVYLVPCDEQAILAHIRQTYIADVQNGDTPETYASQFLAKFFQMTLRLPPAADFAVEDYLDRELRESKMEDLTADARDVLLLAYRGDTPRQVKRVLNDLIAYRGLAEEVEARGLVEAGALTSDLGHLTKMAVLSAKWPSFMSRLAEDPVVWTDVMQKVRDRIGVSQDNVPGDLEQFLWNTRLVSPDADIRPWLYLSRNATEKDSKLTRRVEEVLQNGRWSQYEALAAQKEFQEKTDQIAQLVSATMRRWLVADHRVLVRNGGPILLKLSLSRPEDADLKREAINMLDYVSAAASDEDMEQLFDITDIVSIAQSSLTSWPAQNVLGKYARLFANSSPASPARMKTWMQVIQHGNLLRESDRRLIQTQLTSRHSMPPTGQSDVLSILEFAGTDPASSAWVVTPDLLNAIIGAVTFTEANFDTKRVNAVLAFRERLNDSGKTALLQRIETAVQPSRTSQPDDAAQAAVAALNQLDPRTLRTTEIEKVAQALLAQATRAQVPDRAVWLDGIIHLHATLVKEIKAQADTLIRNSFNDADPNQTTALLQRMSGSARQRLLALDTYRTLMRLQASNYFGRYRQNAAAFRGQQLSEFDPAQVLSIPSIFDPEQSWDLALYLHLAAKAVEAGKLQPAETGQRIEDFVSNVLPSQIGKQTELYNALLQLLQKQPGVTTTPLADIVASCELARISGGDYSEYPRFKNFKAGLPEERRIELMRQATNVLSSRGENWVKLLSHLVDDIASDAPVAENLSLTSDLADFAFSAARDEWLEARNALPQIVGLLEPSKQQDYVDRALDALLALEADGEDLPKMQPFLNLVASYPAHATGLTGNKAVRFVQRITGAAKPDNQKLAGLQLASALAPNLLAPMKPQITSLIDNPNAKIAEEAKSLIRTLESLL